MSEKMIDKVAKWLADNCQQTYADRSDLVRYGDAEELYWIITGERIKTPPPPSQAAPSRVREIKRNLHLAIESIARWVKDNGPCECGFEEPMGEGYASGVCYLHEAMDHINAARLKLTTESCAQNLNLTEGEVTFAPGSYGAYLQNEADKLKKPKPQDKAE